MRIPCFRSSMALIVIPRGCPQYGDDLPDEPDAFIQLRNYRLFLSPCRGFSSESPVILLLGDNLVLLGLPSVGGNGHGAG